MKLLFRRLLGAASKLRSFLSLMFSIAHRACDKNLPESRKSSGPLAASRRPGAPRIADCMSPGSEPYFSRFNGGGK
jgi:hypothetical protein